MLSCNLDSPLTHVGIIGYRETWHSLSPPYSSTLGRVQEPALVLCGTRERRVDSASALRLTQARRQQVICGKAQHLITNLREGGESTRGILTPRCILADVGTHCLPGLPKGSVPPGHSSPHPIQHHSLGHAWGFQHDNF